MKNRILLIITSAVLIFSVTACSSAGNNGTEVPGINPSIDNPPALDALAILSTSSFTDQYGGYYVIGEVINNSDTPVTSVGLDIQLTDASGASLLRDDTGAVINNATFYTMLNTITPGKSSPFSYYYDTKNGTPANYDVTISTFDTTNTIQGQLESQNIQIIEDGYGDYFLTGEVVNLSDQWVHIWGLAGGVLDDTGTVLSANMTFTYKALLAPTGDANRRDRSPFSVSIHIPQTDVTQWDLWWDAEITSDFSEYALEIEVTNSYFDEFGSAHLVGIIKNNSDTALISQIVAGLYAEDGTTLDASYAFLPLPVLPGSDLPFDITYFGNVNYSTEQASLVSTYTVQLDLWRTSPPANEIVAMAPAGETIQKDGSTWTISGNFANTTNRNVNGVTILVAVYDLANKLVAMGYTYPSGDVFEPGAGDTYEVVIYLAPGLDTTGFTTQTIVVGDVSE